MPKILAAPETYEANAFANTSGRTECVEFVRQTLYLPATYAWSEGIKVKKLAAGEADPVARGTAIATFVNGRYPRTGSTGKHAAIYLGQNDQGIQVMDQWAAQGKVARRTIPWLPRGTGLSNNGSAFSVIE